MKKIVIFIITILVLGVLSMATCIQNSKLIEQEKNKEQIANKSNEVIDFEEDTEKNENKKEEVVTENVIEEQKKEGVAIENIVAEQKKEVINQQQESKTTTKTTEVNTKTENNVNKTDEKKEVEQHKKVENINTETKKETQIDNNYTEINVNVAEKEKCDGNNHGISTGNTGLWFETKEKAITTYKAEIKIWGDKWTNDEISDDEYYKNCPYGYEVWSCPYCNKWTLNYYLEK